MNESALRHAICEVGRRLYHRNLVAATDGNISIRLGEDRFLCTPSGVSKGFMAPDDLVIADAQGCKVAGAGKVTSEFFTHLAAFEERPEIQAVVHAHPPMATAITVAGLSLTDPILPEVVFSVGAIPTAPYATPGTPEGAVVVRDLIRRCDAILLDRHGALTIGMDVFEAYHKMEKLEHAAQIYLAARTLGTPAILNADAIARILAAREAYGATGPIFPVG